MSRQPLDLQYYGIERQSQNKVQGWIRKERPDLDLLNILSGHNPGDASVPQKIDDLSSLHALPLNGEAFDNTAADKLISEKASSVWAEIENRITDTKLKNQIFNNARIDNPESVKQIAESLKGKYNVKDRAPRLEMAVKFLTLKARDEFEKKHPLHINPDDSKAAIAHKVNEHNRAFRQEMVKARRGILDEFKKDNSDPLYDTVSKIHRAIDSTTSYCNNVLTSAGQYEGDFRQQKRSLLEHTNHVNSQLDSASPKKQEQRIQHRIEVEQKKLKNITESATEGSERDALQWAIDEARLDAKYRQTRTEDDSQALTDHRTKRPTDYDKHREAIAPKLRDAQPAIKALAGYEVMKIRSQANPPIIKKVKTGFDQEATLNDHIEHYAKGVLPTTADKNDVAEKSKDERSYTEVAILEHAYDQNKTSENKKAFEKARDKYDKEHKKEPYENAKLLKKGARKYHSEKGINDSIKEIAKHRVEIQKSPSRERHVYALAKARMQYQSELTKLSRLIHDDKTGEELENPHPALLKKLQKQAGDLHLGYQVEVDRVHKEARTLQTLQQVSSPLTALRAVNSSILGQNIVSDAMRSKGWLEPSKHGAARLDVLDLAKYEVPLNPLPNELVLINNLTGEINQLLDEREEMEHAIEADPSVAPQYAEAIAKNTSALKSKLTDLQKETAKAERAGYLQTHPDVETWAAKAGVLFDNINRGNLKERNKVANAAAEFLRTRRALGISPSRWLGHTDRVDGINQTKYNPETSKGLSTTMSIEYYEDLGSFRYRTKGLKVEVEHPDGSKREEDVKFKRAEINKHFEDFIRISGLEVGTSRRDVKVSEKNGTITYTWPDEKTRDEFHKYLKKQYQEQRKEELKTEKANEHTAKVDVEGVKTGNDDSSFSGIPLSMNP